MENDGNIFHSHHYLPSALRQMANLPPEDLLLAFPPKDPEVSQRWNRGKRVKDDKKDMSQFMWLKPKSPQKVF